jgi:hypothetical protein
MFLLPFIFSPNKAPGLHQIWLFLERNGSHMIKFQGNTPEEGIAHAKEFLSINGLEGSKEPFCANDVVFCPVSSTTPDLTNFYTWKETPVGTTPPREVWRSFLWAHAEDAGDPWGVNRMMESISLSDKGDTVYSIMKHIALRP